MGSLPGVRRYGRSRACSLLGWQHGNANARRTSNYTCARDRGAADCRAAYRGTDDGRDHAWHNGISAVGNRHIGRQPDDERS